MWSKYITRRLAVQVAQAWNFGWGKAMKKIYGVWLEDTLVFRDSNKTEYYVNERQYKKYIKDLYRLLEKDKFIKNFHRDAQIKLENILEDVKNRFNQDLAKLSKAELLKLYKSFILPNMEQFYVRMWTVFNIAEPLADVLKKKLERQVKDKGKVDRYLLSLLSQQKPNDILKERIDILKLAAIKNKLSKKEFLKETRKHTKKYQHIPMFDFDHDPYREDYFLDELKNIKKPKEELNKLKKLFINNRKRFKKILKEIKPNKRFKNLLQFLKENIFLRDHRDMIRQKLNLELKKFYSEVGERLSLNLKQVAVLTNDEIIEYLGNNKKFFKKEIMKRGKVYLLIQKRDKVKIYSGNQAIGKFKRELNISKTKRVKEIKGIVVSKGIVRGRVKVVYTNRDLSKVRKGDILVAAVTRQDFVPVMRKAKAIITDEGGIICHTAIISRELNIPCIVGTKIATEILKDNDIVEVDANRGNIKILKRNC